MATTFDFETALKQLQSGQALTGENGILTPLIKQLTEAALEAEIENYIEANPKQGNRRNGYTRKTVKSTSGSFELETPRDRNGEFEPQLVKKNQTKLSEEIDNKIISLYALGMSYRDIQKHVADMYGLEISDGAITNITDKLLPQLQAWKQRPLDTIYPFVWLDAIHYKVKDKGVYVSKAIYTILALNVEAKKELLGLHLSESEGANHWLSVLTDLQNRGVQDILIACLAKQRFSGLKGFPEAIAAIYPQTEIQLCIVHQIRNSL
ncbi:IS256 family transposase, partial [Acinetobacter towneri]|uniref:IS256 family transposase n=1 Tax=Acinetobacter towneri TaxID=202956 RepID=UPI00209AEA9E